MKPNPAAIAVAVVLALLWAALSGGEDWAFGAVAIGAVVLVSHALLPLPRSRVSPAGLLRFLGFFLHGSVVGGLDVARRALSPSLPLDVRRYRHPVRLPPGAARAVLVGAISLLPGTLSVRLRGESLLVHSIAGDPADTIARLEQRVAAVFDGSRPAPGGGPDA